MSAGYLISLVSALYFDLHLRQFTFCCACWFALCVLSRWKGILQTFCAAPNADALGEMYQTINVDYPTFEMENQIEGKTTFEDYGFTQIFS